jgi:hypothetical protein
VSQAGIRTSDFRNTNDKFCCLSVLARRFAVECRRKGSNRTLVLSTEWKWAVSFTSLPIYGWLSRRFGPNAPEERKFVPFAGIEPRSLWHPARSQSLCRLSYPGSVISKCPDLSTFHTCLVTQRRWKLAVTSCFVKIPTMSVGALPNNLLLKEPETVTGRRVWSVSGVPQVITSYWKGARLYFERTWHDCWKPA